LRGRENGSQILRIQEGGIRNKSHQPGRTFVQVGNVYISMRTGQSHTGTIQFLPALPRTWQKYGSFKGLCARGGYIVDCAWENGKVLNYKITSAKPTKVKVRVNGELKEINT
jgi:hypothetical protein